MRSKAGMARKGKLKRHSDSEANAIAANVSVKAPLPSLQDKPYPSLGLCVSQAILEETPVLHICIRNNQCHVLLQRYACKRLRLDYEASSFDNSWNSCSILVRSDFRRPEIQNIPGRHARRPAYNRKLPLRISAYARDSHVLYLPSVLPCLSFQLSQL